MDKKLEQILDECLDRVVHQGESLESCLAQHPQHARELEPLLRAALAVQRASTIAPNPSFRTGARRHLLNSLRLREGKRARGLLPWAGRWVAVTIPALLAFLVSGATIAAASDSLPDEPLYPVKLATEQAQDIFIRTPESKAQFQARLAQRRNEEILEMTRKNKPRDIDRAARRLAGHLARMEAMANQMEEEGKAPERAELRVILESYAMRQQAALEKALERAPEPARPALRRALERSQTGYEQAFRKLERRLPPKQGKEKLPPGPRPRPAAD